MPADSEQTRIVMTKDIVVIHINLTAPKKLKSIFSLGIRIAFIKSSQRTCNSNTHTPHRHTHIHTRFVYTFKQIYVTFP